MTEIHNLIYYVMFVYGRKINIYHGAAYSNIAVVLGEGIQIKYMS